ncbi:hypothetical protein ACC733_36035 [Rhizobium johnstonii]|uniref:hypothetical protein n=1 Tax=Rhizobium johnstonii TaxID=3019933 RepID=UPI003F9B6021
MARPSENIEHDASSLKEEEPDHDDFGLGIDIGKNSCSVVGVDDKSSVIVRRTMRRQTLIEFAGKTPACIIALEAKLGRSCHRIKPRWQRKSSARYGRLPKTALEVLGDIVVSVLQARPDE